MDDLALITLAVTAVMHVPLFVCWLLVVWRNPDDRRTTTLLAIMSLLVMFCGLCCYYMVRLAGVATCFQC